MNYELMSDFEINDAVKSVLIDSHGSETDFDKFFLDALKRSNLDYCNNPSVAWPIIIENKISIHHEIARYKASSLVYSDKYEHGFNIFSFDGAMGDTSSRAALRAAMIVFLMMSEK